MQFSRDAQALAHVRFESDSKLALHLLKTQLVKGPKQSEKSSQQGESWQSRRRESHGNAGDWQSHGNSAVRTALPLRAAGIPAELPRPRLARDGCGGGMNRYPW